VVALLATDLTSWPPFASFSLWRAAEAEKTRESTISVENGESTPNTTETLAVRQPPATP
jgi:hypothetical protein